MPEDDWVIVNEFGKNSVMIRESDVAHSGSLVRAPVRYLLDPPGTDKRNGRAIAEWTLIEEYDLEKSLVRLHRGIFTYVGGESGEQTFAPDWQPATAGSEKTLLYLRGAIQRRH